MRDRWGRLIYTSVEKQCSTLGHTAPAIVTCTFALAGKKSGQICGRRICDACAAGSTLCPPHRRLTAKSLAH